MSIVADIASIATVVLIFGFAVWITTQLFKKS